MSDWRVLLYLPLGILPSLFFGLRFLIQWLQSERMGQSVVPAIFWRLSLVGNCLLMMHLFIQMQFPLALLQVINGVISWRNLNLMGAAGKPVTTQTALKVLVGVTVLFTAIFALQAPVLGVDLEWLRIPTKPWDSSPTQSVPIAWHALGVLGASLFASRFWVQWWEAERQQTSTLGPAFWWLSLVGNLLSLTYFIRIEDLANIAKVGFGFIPALRNLFLLRRARQLA